MLHVSIMVRNKSKVHWTNKFALEANKVGLKTSVVTLNSLNDQKVLDQLGDLLFWRGSRLIYPEERTVLALLQSDKLIVNRQYLVNPSYGNKYFQQQLVQRAGLTGIESYMYHDIQKLKKALKNGIIVFPFIAKLNISSRGEGVYLINSESDLKQLKAKCTDYVFQNFINNDYDYRVLVLGGRALGVIRRQRDKNEFRNNVYQGGDTYIEKDHVLYDKVARLGLKINSLFGYQFSGVDIMPNKATGELRFMEINWGPAWDGFAKTTNINVEAELAKYFKQILLNISI